MPKDFGFNGPPGTHPDSIMKLLARSTLARVDLPGTILLLFAVVSLTAGFEEADSEFPWKSAYVITLLVLSGCLWVILLLWERYVTKKDSVREPVLPWRFFLSRTMIGTLL